MNMVTPTSAPTIRAGARKGPPRKYDWDRVVVGEWQNWISPENDQRPLTDIEARRRFNNIQAAAREWAWRNGLSVETRRVDHGRVVDLRFTPSEEAAR